MSIINERYRIIEKLSDSRIRMHYKVVDLYVKDELVECHIIRSLQSSEKLYSHFMHHYLKYASLNQPNLKRVRGFDVIKQQSTLVAKEFDYFYIVDYVNEALVDYNTLNFDEKISALQQIIYAVRYCHFRGVGCGSIDQSDIVVYRDQHGVVRVKLSAVPTIVANNYLANKITLAEDEDLMTGDVASIINMLRAALSMVSANSANKYSDLNRKLAALLASLKATKVSIEALIDVLQTSKIMAFPFNDKHYYETIDFNSGIISRKAELRQLSEEINRRFDGRSSLVGAFVSGRMGIGKTRFLREIVFRLKTKGRFAFIVDLVEPSENPNRLIAQLFKQFMASGHVNKALIAKFGGDLVKIMPEYIDIWGISPSLPLSKENEQLKLNNRFIQFIIELSQLISPVIVIENIHYLNYNERTLLQMLLEVVTDVPIYVICSAIYDVFDEENYNYYRPSNEILNINLNELKEYDIDQLLKCFFYRTKDFDYIVDSVKSLTAGSPRSIEILLKYFLDNKIIWVDEDRCWHCKPFEHEAHDYKTKLADAYTTLLKSIDEPTMVVLKYVSLFKDSADVKVLRQLLSEYAEDFNDLINKLIVNNFLCREQQMSNEYIAFIDGELKQIIYERIPDDEKIKYHYRTAEVYRLADNKWQRADYLYHLLRSNQYQKALEVAMTLASEIEKMQFIDKAISLHEIARDIAFQLDNYEVAIGIIRRIAEIYYFKGEVEIASMQYQQLAEMSQKHGCIDAYLDAEIKRVEIDLRCGRVLDFEREIVEIAQCAEAIKYHKGHFDICYIKFMRSLNDEDIESAKQMLPLFIAISERDESQYLMAKTLIVKGLLYDFEGDYGMAFRSLQEAKKQLNAIDNSYELSIVENNLGVLTVEILGDLKRAKSHFRSALNYLKKSSIIIERNKYLNNLGEVQRVEGNLIESLNSHREALRISYNVQDVEEIMLTLAHLIETYSGLSKYDLAYAHVEKLLDFIEQYSDVILVGLYERIYYAISLFYLKIFNRKNAKKYFDKFIQSKTDYLDHLSGFRMRIHQFSCQYYLADNRLDYDFNYDDIKQMINLASREIEKALLKEVLLDIVIDMICFDGREEVVELLDCYRQVEATSFSEILSFKQSIVELYMNRSEALTDVDNCDTFYRLGDEEKLKVYIIMGNYFALKGDYYGALRQYLEAVDNIRSVYLTLDKRLQEAYVLKDELKRNLFDCINILMNKIDKSFIIPLDMNVASLLDLEPYYKLYQSEAFRQSIYRRYKQKHGLIFETLDDLLNKLDSDNKTNITVALKYLTQQVFADFASLIMISPDQTISKVFEIDDNLKNNNYSVLISHYVSVDKPVILSEDKLSQMGIYDLKKAMLIPVYAKYAEEEKQLQYNRRRKQIRDYEPPHAIVFIASHSRLNFLNDNMIHHVQQALPIIFLIIDNYNLYRSSTIDKLTGVYLRKPLEKIFVQQMEDCKRMSESFSVVMLDIDHFKVINDEYGHRKGDVVLAQIADIIVKSVRGDDAVGRYGGEEFIVLLPTATAEKAYEIAERIRKNIEEADLLEDGKKVTISAGIAVYPEMGDRQSELIEKADKALYVSKNSGRNLTTIYARGNMSEDKRFDPLAGILTGTTSRDARVMKAIVDIIALLATTQMKEHKIQFALSSIIDLLEASDASIIDLNKNVRYVQYAKVKGKQKTVQVKLSNESDFTLADYTQEGYFIKWDTVVDINNVSGRPKWHSYIQCPIVINGQKKGIIAVRVPIAEKKFEFSDYNIVLHIARIIGGFF